MAMAGVMPIPPATRTRDLYLKKKNPNTNCGQMLTQTKAEASKSMKKDMME